MPVLFHDRPLRRTVFSKLKKTQKNLNACGGNVSTPKMQKRRGSYTIDQLLRFKRSERPSDAFWGEFDRELYLKQRLLLQGQSNEEIDLDAAPWTRMRKLATALTAIAACWVVGFVALKLEEVPDSSKAAISDVLAAALNSDTRVSQPDLATVVPDKDASPFLEVSNPVELIEQEIYSEPILATAVMEDSPAPSRRYFVQASYTLDFDSIMEPIGFEDAIAFDADESVTRILEKYTHPLSDRGWKYDQYLANRSDPLNRISAAAFDLDVFERETRRDRKLNKLTLKF